MRLAECSPSSLGTCTTWIALSLAEANICSAGASCARFDWGTRKTVVPLSLTVLHGRNQSYYGGAKICHVTRSRKLLSGVIEDMSSCDSFSVLVSAAGQGNAAVLDESMGLNNPSTLPSEEATFLRGFSKQQLTDIGGENYKRTISGHNAVSKPLRVAVDVDEVLGSFLSSLNLFIGEQYAQKFKLSEYHVYDFMKIWGCSQAEANDRVHAFFDSEQFNDGIIPVPGAYQSLCHLAEFCHLVVVTSRQHVIEKPTLEWIERHYSGIFKEVHFGNHFALEGKSRPKCEICR
eukprot:c26817_g1_i3 orf=723-1592(+)